MPAGTLLAMSAALAVGAFLAGSLPLWITLSHSHMHKLEAVGTGLLLGAALGVIIPEGVETLIEQANKEAPITQIALSLLLGFTFMFILEQFIVPSHTHSHPHPHQNPSIPRRPVSRRNSQSSRVEFDAEVDLDQLERELASEGGPASEHKPLHPSGSRSASPHRDHDSDESIPQGAKAITAGLIVHALADGLALGVSTLSSPQGATSQATGKELSFIVFLALLIHKAPTSLALTTTLLSKGLSRNAARGHLAAFSMATPVGALASYFFFGWMSTPEGLDWTGLTLLFSGGTFLYVATVLQPVADTSSETEQVIGNRTRALFVIVGMFLPFGISALVGHGH